MRYTPENITTLQPDEVFVFGSNMNGFHAAGAARIALEKFGAIDGQASGIQGRSYAIPTLSEDMERLNLETIGKYVEEFCAYASENPDTTFLVTKIGCGIAGFDTTEMANLFDGMTIPANVVLPEEFTITHSFKGFDKELKCRGFQYEIGKTYEQEEAPKVCGSGFHSCLHPLDVFSFYPNAYGNRFCSVTNYGRISNIEDGDTKIASRRIKINTEIGFAGLAKEAAEHVVNNCNSATTGDEANSATTGYWAHSATTGYWAHSATTGDEANSATTGYCAHSATTGYCAHSATTGDEAHSATTGYRAHSATTGYRAHSATTGDCAHSATTGDCAHSATTGDCAHSATTGDEANSATEGSHCISFAGGISGKAKAAVGSWLVLAEWLHNDEGRAIKEVKAIQVDGEAIKADTLYELKDGEFTECEEWSFHKQKPRMAVRGKL